MTLRLVSMVVLGIAVMPAAQAHAGGWTQPKGEFYGKVWNRSLVGRQIFVSERTTARLDSPYQDHQLNVYGEYGLTDDFTLTLNGAALGYAVFGDESRAYSGGGSVGVRYRLTRGDVSTAIEAQLGGRPTSGSLGSGVVEVQRNGTLETEAFDARPAVGTGVGTLEVQVGFALPFVWMSTTVGLRAFTNDRLKPAFYVNPQIGWNTNFGLVLDLHMNWFHSSGDIGPINVYGAAQTRYLGIGIGASWWFTDHFALNLGMDSVLFATANAATPSLAIGVEFR